MLSAIDRNHCPPSPESAADLWSCQNAGSSSAPLPGSIAAAAWPRIGSASTEKRSRSCASPQSASCSESYVIRPEVSGRTLSDLIADRERMPHPVVLRLGGSAEPDGGADHQRTDSAGRSEAALPARSGTQSPPNG